MPKNIEYGKNKRKAGNIFFEVLLRLKVVIFIMCFLHSVEMPPLRQYLCEVGVCDKEIA
jgi:hypothetical protein